MAVIITNGATTLNTANGFYEVEAHNLAGVNSVVSVSWQSLSTVTPQYIYPTFAHAVNIKGVGIVLETITSGTVTRNVDLFLEQYQTVDSFNTSTEKVLKTAHGLLDNDIVVFTSTGTLPTGITSLTQYYVVNKTDNDFQISASLGGSAIGLSGTPSGTATVGKILATKSKTPNEITAGNLRSGNDYPYAGCYIQPFEFATPVAVTTDASKYRIRIMTNTAGTGSWYTRSSGLTSTTALIYFAWGDTAKSFTDDDTVIVKDKLIVDKTASLGGVLGTDDSVNGTCMMICSNTADITSANVALLEWENTPASSYTLTIKGNILGADFSGIRVGTSASPIPYAQRAIIDFGVPTVGSVTPAIRGIGSASGSYCYGGHLSLFLYGEVGTDVKTTLAQNVTVGDSVIYTTDEMNWVNGDTIVIGKQDTISVGSYATYTVSLVSGTAVTLTGTVASYDRIAGGTVFKYGNNHGILIRCSNGASGISSLYLGACPNFVVSGVDITRAVFYPRGTTSYYYVTYNYPANASAKHLVQDVVGISISTSEYYLFSFIAHKLGGDIRRVYTHRMSVLQDCVAFYSAQYKSGRITMENCATVTNYSATTSSSSSIRLTIQNCSFENGRGSSYPFYYVCGINSIYHDNYIWGNGGATSAGAIAITTSVNALSYNNTYEKCGMGMYNSSGATIINCKFLNESFAPTYANTLDIYFFGGGYCDITFQDCSGITNIDSTYVGETTDGTMFRFVNYNDTANDDFILATNGEFQRTGDGLADTIVHTSGASKFALRFEPIGGELAWQFDIPTGNIDDLDMTVGVWVKINSANYYSGTHVNPTLTVDYDNGTTKSIVATDTTDWQFLTVSFKPTTTYGKIVIKILGETDQTSTDAYFYVDDFSTFYPSGYVLNLGGLDDWSGALPVTPPIATTISAADIWNYPTSGLTGAGTTGKQQKDLLTVGKFIGLS